MKDLTQAKEEKSELNLVEQAAQIKPEFATRQAAIEAYTERLESFAKKCGRSVAEMLKKAEHSADFDEDCEEAMRLWRSISALKRRL